MVKHEIEIEFKNILTKNEFNKITRQFLFPHEAVKQTNYYFETVNFDLSINKAALRIREKNNQYKATLKRTKEKSVLETHISLNDEAARNCFKNDLSPLQAFTPYLQEFKININDLYFKGSLTTYRKEKLYKDCLIVLDKSFYNSVKDYEFELETNNFQYGEKVFNEILSSLQIPKRKTLNKIERFFKTKNK